MKKLFPYQWYTSFWFSWLVVTAIYLLLSFAGGLGVYQGTFLGYVTGLFGLVTPIGVFSFMASLEGWRMVAFLIVAVSVLGVDAAVARFASGPFSPFLKIMFNIAILFVLTFLVDLVLYQAWPSLTIFLNGGITTAPTFL